ncbi:G0/G1 switch protein 2-like [Xyrichtys novacula]|uniref:G0/G1 switch protein 2-like n=1 Tax=Xyrichtys novacula TaxID=13765 RepID=A0AAV1ESL6_XYRNO|nr:G0/G1 switch protein 2-like [Xyrichtys novacula]
MENLQELTSFAKEMMSQKPSRGLLKVYLVGSVFAVLGTVIGLVETVCHPFSSGEPMDAEMLLMLAKEQRTVEAGLQDIEGSQEEEEEEEEEVKKNKEEACENSATTKSVTLSKKHGLGQRSLSNRLHAS